MIFDKYADYEEVPPEKPFDERYLDLLAEECAEVIQAVMKIKRFGLNDKYPNGKTGREVLVEEIQDVMVILDHLNFSEEDEMIMVNHIDKKRAKLKIYGPDGSYLNDLLHVDLEKRDIAFISLTEHIETKSPQREMVFHIMAAFAQFERDMISERTPAGIAEAKRKGTWKSKPVSFTEEQWIKALEEAAKDTSTAKKIAAVSGLKLNIVYKHIEALRDGKEWKWGDNTMENQKKKGKKK